MSTIPVAEIFGPTIQGEGALAGLPTYFLRTGGCDFSCYWCDSSHAVLADEVRKLVRMTQEEITEDLMRLEVRAPGPEWLTISGGNPALHDLSQVVESWKAHSRHTFRSDEAYPQYKVAVETQGTKWQRWFADVDLLTISPKPPSSGMVSIPAIYDFIRGPVADAEEINYRRDVIENRKGWQAVLKVVVFDEADYQFARALHARYPLIKFYLSCGTAMGGLSSKWYPPMYGDAIMVFRPQIDDVGLLLDRYRWLADRMKGDPIMADVAAFPQLHALTWGIETRGV